MPVAGSIVAPVKKVVSAVALRAGGGWVQQSAAISTVVGVVIAPYIYRDVIVGEMDAGGCHTDGRCVDSGIEIGDTRVRHQRFSGNGGGDTTIKLRCKAMPAVLRALEVVIVALSAISIVGGIGCGTVLSVLTTTLGFGTIRASAVTLGSWACWGWCGTTTLVRQTRLIGVG